MRPAGAVMTDTESEVAEEYATRTLLASSDGRSWRGLRADRWRFLEGELGEVQARDNLVIVMLEGKLHIRWRRDGRMEKGIAVPGTAWVCPSGFRADMLHFYGDVPDTIYLSLPELWLSETALRELDIAPDKVTVNYEGWSHDALIEQIARQIHAELLNPMPAGNMLAETLASALGVYLLRRRSNLNPASVSLPAVRGALDPRRLRRVKDFIETHLDGVLSIEALANEACLSPFHFSRAFKAATGMTPHDYLTNRRIERAKVLIAQGRVPLAEIARLCGFSSQAYFTTWFKRAVGTTPRAYRECRR